MSIAEAKRHLDHGCDGPITKFVLISRATDPELIQKFGHEAVSNALYEALCEYGMPGDPHLYEGSVYNSAD